MCNVLARGAGEPFNGGMRTKNLIRPPARIAAWTLALLLSACGGGGDDPAPAATDDLLSLQVAGHPHAVDVYRTAGARRAIVLLHGGGGNRNAIAYQVGLNASATTTSMATIDWAWLHAHQVMLVVPQGQSLPSEPGATTWTNHAMNSGVDDQAFLQALATRLRTDFGLTHLTLMGHSMGGVMTNRMWCESPMTFDAYVSIAGPASSFYNGASTPCGPGDAARPYLGIVGDRDDVMQTAGAWAAATWTVNPLFVGLSFRAWDNDVMIGEFRQQQARTAVMCGGTLAEGAFTRGGNVDTWSSCGGRLVLQRVAGADHGVASIDAQMGLSSSHDVMDAAAAFSAGP
ncbi:hypothetical protein A4W93_10280 [Piscinibacter gummiphilus]|uniref:Uncharacterized protein n=1 Tax=Piscinibacter gummiphilus TaxID=946333 RepID=A0A1W6L7S6_9BURK|nr:hypothetical protein A4W93_10280 [Piscinibacter gummiphilus]ATU64928.1 hypothetical protein CPZ87_10355 [Piscinibacter gummiphilus]GLS96439.1 hypothetical protein GCM10007918_37310 [Piscinibacter gummiphilus]